MNKLKLNPKYNALGNGSRYFVVTGGRGSGKSFSITVFLALLTLEQDEKVLFTRYTMIAASVSIIPEFIEKIELLGLTDKFNVGKDEIIYIPTGSSIIFKGIKTSAGNQTANLKSLQGVTCWVLDEAEELVDEDLFDKIDLSVRSNKKQNRVILILNPATKEHWIYQRFFLSNGVNEGSNKEKDNVTYIHSTYKDNEDNLPESFLNSIAEMRRRRPDKYNHQILGGWLDKAEGTIYNNWTLGKFNEYAPSIFGQDFGFSVDPTVLVKISVDKDKKKVWVKGMYGKVGMSTSEIIEHNLRHVKKDDLIISDSSEPRLVENISLHCNIKPTIKKSGSILSGIALLQDFDMIIDPDSTDIVKELNNYVWHKRNSKPIDNWNHYLDAIRYALDYFMKNANKGNYVIR